ncbi:hypothetical protein TNCV_5026411 [Trichonephila clavipes]|uniref:Uncharacterized protein n=1 Tax=Trichonephila clavipes TaxID=2585209 RepID=A0A8X6V998_TRICX|nr:hypothetical protein TNCV_5026411 [Trichonephila clavipes]
MPAFEISAVNNDYGTPSNDISLSTLKRLVYRTDVRKVGGYPRKTTASDDRYIILQAKRDCNHTLGNIVQHLHTVSRQQISREDHTLSEVFNTTRDPSIVNHILVSIPKVLLTISGDKLNKNKAGKGQKRFTSVDDRRIKRLCLQDGRMSSMVIRRYLNYAGVSVSSRTVRK